MPNMVIKNAKVALLFVGPLIFLLALVLSVNPNRTPSSNLGLVSRDQLAGPFIEGTRVSLDAARTEAGFPIRIPDDALANSATLDTVWHERVPPEINQVALEFSSGVEILLTPNIDPVDPYQYVAEVAEAGPPATIPLIHGVPAMVLPANSVFADGGWTEQDAVVSIDLEGVNYEIYGAYPADDLIRIAESLPIPQQDPSKLPEKVLALLETICSQAPGSCDAELSHRR